MLLLIKNLLNLLTIKIILLINKLNWKSILKIVIFLIPFFAVISFGVSEIFKDAIDKRVPCVDSSKDEILKTDSLKYDIISVKEHNEMLISILRENMSADLYTIQAIDNRMNQADIIYFMLLVAILTYLLAWDRSNNFISKSIGMSSRCSWHRDEMPLCEA